MNLKRIFERVLRESEIDNLLRSYGIDDPTPEDREYISFCKERNLSDEERYELWERLPRFLDGEQEGQIAPGANCELEYEKMKKGISHYDDL